MRIFLISSLLTFLMVFLPHLGAREGIVSPLARQADVKEMTPAVSAASEYDSASAYALVDFDSGKIILSKNLSKRLPMASLTKVMTAVVALDLADPKEQFAVSSKAAAEVPTKVMLRQGERYTLSNLLEHILISSANDSARVIKEGINAKAGQEVFIEVMNEKAKFLGLKNTHFTNAEGYDNPDHFSSAEDLSVLAVYALKNYPLIAQTVSKETEDLTKGGQDMRFYLQNWNGLLGVYPGTVGLKIGNTKDAGYTTIVVSEREGEKLLAVVLGAPGVLERDLWASALLDLGFGKLASLPPVNVSEEALRQKYASWQYFQ